MGRAIGIGSTMFAGIRVAGQVTFIPAHTKNGKQISAKCVIPVYLNSNKGTNQRTGEEGRVDSFKLVAWGKLAETCAKSLPKGKALDVVSTPQSYLGTVYNADGSVRMDATGQPIQQNKVSFTILSIVFGEESEKAIAEEIQTGRRPAAWNVPSHPDYQLWLGILKQRQATVWDGRSSTFGFARVVVPGGPGVILGHAQPEQQGMFAGYAGATSPAYTAPLAAPAWPGAAVPGYTPAAPAQPGFPGHPGYGGGATLPPAEATASIPLF